MYGQDGEHWIYGRIWGVHKRWEMSTGERGAWTPGDNSVSDERYSESFGLLMVTGAGKTWE